MVLAINSGIPVETWWAGDERDLITALDVLDRERREQQGNKPDRDEQGRVTSG